MEKLLQQIDRFLNGPEICLFHEFHKPPYGGGNTFLIALEKELKKQGRSVGRNKVGENTKVILFNSFNFKFDDLKRIVENFHPLMVHRVDGPISVYRDTDKEIDEQIWKLNHELADVTIFQSQYSQDKHEEMDLNFKNPHIISNASDPEIFHSRGRVSPPTPGRKVRLIATSWSDNPKKGGSTLAWLDENLDHEQYDLTFVGRTKAEFKNAHIIPPLPSDKLAEILRQQDIYIAASENDPCSNALIEALSCGLPAVYLDSGGHPELVGNSGVSFHNTDDLLKSVDQVTRNYTYFQERIKVEKLSSVAQKYLEAFSLHENN